MQHTIWRVREDFTVKVTENHEIQLQIQKENKKLTNDLKKIGLWGTKAPQGHKDLWECPFLLDSSS